MTLSSSSTADPVSAALAARVRVLREARGWRQEDLAVEMTKLGFKWGRTTVFKLETGKRVSLDPGEWFGLARVFGVPALWLLCDPREPGRVPLGPDLEMEPWDAYFWIAGLDPGVRTVPVTWASASTVLELGVAHLQICGSIGDLQLPRVRPETEEARSRRDEEHRQYFDALLDVRRRLVGLGAQLPAVHPRVARRAVELGVDLDASAGEG